MPAKKKNSTIKSKQKTTNKTKRKASVKKKKGHSPIHKFWSWVGRLAILGFIVGFLFFMAVYLGFLGYVPSKAQLEQIKNPVASEVYSQSGKLLGRYYIENRSNVHFEDISPNVIHALVATEDSRFYEHRGIDEIALARVFFKSIILHDHSSGGGSTLSQQIAKNLFPRNDLWIFSMPVNKLREAIIAYRLERIYSKNEILTLYLNTVPFGENIYGIEVAAERFFNKKPIDLTVDEAAVLIGMLKANNGYNPRIHPERSKERRNVVIQQMVANNYLSQAQANVFQAKPLVIHYHRISYNQGPAPYFLEHLKPELMEWCASHKKANGEPYNLYTDGLKIRTTINADLQAYAQESVKSYMKRLQSVFDQHWANQDPWGTDHRIVVRAELRSDRYRAMKKAGYSDDEISKAFRTKRDMTIFTWNGDKDVNMTPLDSVKHYLRMLNSGFLAMDPSTGNLKAWVGGIDFRYFKYDHVTSSRQVGSTFKPFVYLSAINNGLSPFDYYSNERKVYPNYKNWSPRNSHDDYSGYYSMQGALAKSLNTIAVDVLMRSGIESAIQTAHELGIEQELPDFPSLALGVASISLKEMVTAYSAIINDGVRCQPHYLISITNNDGKVLDRFVPDPAVKTGLDPENCRILMQMLQAVTTDGTGRAIRSVYHIPGEFAGKTGTTQDQSDGWFMGMTPRLVTGCWVGAEDPGIHFRTIHYGQGAYMALPIVGEFFQKVYADPRYQSMAMSHFKTPSRRILSKLDIPEFQENAHNNVISKMIGNVFDGKNAKSDDQLDNRVKVKKKKGLWGRIKGIFKKDK